MSAIIQPIPQTNDVSLVRLYVLRALYLFIVVGLGTQIWPDILNPGRRWDLLEGIVSCVLAAFWFLCLLGLRYPLKMLPVLFWELIWKTLWLGIVALPQWLAGHIDESIVPNLYACSLVVLVYIAMPWTYVYARYLKAPGDRWR
ncbi:MAG TPA: hypothetical protein VII69_11170 [Candidatus Eremiobacteraceae bacterium]